VYGPANSWGDLLFFTSAILEKEKDGVEVVKEKGVSKRVGGKLSRQKATGKHRINFNSAR